jgi:NAD(P)-dependent dehydrogenase (short-subunit alcohol dehydrogenase family)
MSASNDTTEARRVVAITGAGGVLGAAIALRLAQEAGTDLVLSDVSAEALHTTTDRLGDTAARTATILADVSDAVQVDAVVQTAVERFGHLDVLVSNAGASITWRPRTGSERSASTFSARCTAYAPRWLSCGPVGRAPSSSPPRSPA